MNDELKAVTSLDRYIECPLFGCVQYSNKRAKRRKVGHCVSLTTPKIVKQEALRVRSIVIALILIGLVGCSTISTQYQMLDGSPADGPFQGQKIDSKIYSGTVYDFMAQVAPSGSGGNIGGLILLFDLPLSLVADTIIFPYTLSYELMREKENETKSERRQDDS